MPGTPSFPRFVRKGWDTANRDAHFPNHRKFRAPQIQLPAPGIPQPLISSRALNPLHPNQLFPLPRLRNLISGLHPHQRVHLHSERLLDAQRHIP